MAYLIGGVAEWFRAARCGVTRRRVVRVLRVGGAWAGIGGLALGGLVARAAAPSVEQRIEAAARQQLDEQAARANWIDPLFDVAVVKTSRPTPACAQEPAIETVDAKYPSRMRFTAICPGTDGWRLDFIARGTVSAQVLVATADVASGRPLGAADVQLERRNVTATPDAMSDLRAAAGLASRRAIRSGDMLRKSLLAAAVLVRRGDAVRIEARSGAVDVSVAGEALDAGGQGDLVRVRNASSGNVISARVTGSGTVAPQQ